MECLCWWCWNILESWRVAWAKWCWVSVSSPHSKIPNGFPYNPLAFTYYLKYLITFMYLCTHVGTVHPWKMAAYRRWFPLFHYVDPRDGTRSSVWVAVTSACQAISLGIDSLLCSLVTSTHWLGCEHLAWPCGWQSEWVNGESEIPE